MAEVGLVKDIKGDQVIVSLNRQEACSKCRACIQGLQEKEMILTAKNLCNASIGDMVEIHLETSNFLKAVMILYGIPFVALIGGIILGYNIAEYFVPSYHTEKLSLIIGFSFLILSYVIIRLSNKRLDKKAYTPMAIKKFS